jgi:hypothetical protein
LKLANEHEINIISEGTLKLIVRVK